MTLGGAVSVPCLASGWMEDSWFLPGAFGAHSPATSRNLPTLIFLSHVWYSIGRAQLLAQLWQLETTKARHDEISHGSIPPPPKPSSYHDVAGHQWFQKTKTTSTGYESRAPTGSFLLVGTAWDPTESVRRHRANARRGANASSPLAGS